MEKALLLVRQLFSFLARSCRLLVILLGVVADGKNLPGFCSRGMTFSLPLESQEPLSPSLEEMFLIGDNRHTAHARHFYMSSRLSQVPTLVRL